MSVAKEIKDHNKVLIAVVVHRTRRPCYCYRAICALLQLDRAHRLGSNHQRLDSVSRSYFSIKIVLISRKCVWSARRGGHVLELQGSRVSWSFRSRESKYENESRSEIVDMHQPMWEGNLNERPSVKFVRRKWACVRMGNEIISCLL